jgi:hypothetical protein
MCYIKDRALSLQRVLGIPLSQALQGVHELMAERLREESLSFQTVGDRHLTRAKRIYGSFELPCFKVSPEKVQRNSARRMERFGMKPGMLDGLNVLDLGCHCGAMLFEAQRFNPAFSLGVEFDAEKIEVARAVARFNGLATVQFRTGDVDRLEPEELGRKFDAVFCLAINKHVKNPDRLFQLLGRLSEKLLFFEGNSGTDPEEVNRRLREAGFASVDYLGLSDDDCVPKNNSRPMFVARKPQP